MQHEDNDKKIISDHDLLPFDVTCTPESVIDPGCVPMPTELYQPEGQQPLEQAERLATVPPVETPHMESSPLKPGVNRPQAKVPSPMKVPSPVAKNKQTVGCPPANVTRSGRLVKKPSRFM